MGVVQEHLNRFNNAKNSLKEWFIRKEISFPEDATIDALMELLPEDIADSSIIDSGQCGENVSWKLYDNGALYIYGEGAIYDYTYEASPFRDVAGIKSIIIENGVTSVGKYIFNMCMSCESVTIADSVTFINLAAFNRCFNLKSIYIGSGMTIIEVYSFDGCESLENIFYNGTKAEWDSIRKNDSALPSLVNATLHCEHDTNADTVNGWHLDVRLDGSDPPEGITNTISLIVTAGG